jgi:nucleotide-binding universal stress UspA family protein
MFALSVVSSRMNQMPLTVRRFWVTVRDEVVQVAKDEEVGLIVSGSPGLAGKAMSFPGSAASRMVTYATCAVMVVQD